jgi:SpoVK/Ycf46/Vps4 family AAA+-type ATPase
VLATNLHQNIDPAFLRRMDFVVEFGLPDQPERRRLWELYVPERLRGEDLDLDYLARLYPVPGAWIRNAAIAAAFLAAAEGGLVGQDHLLASMRREYGKASRPAPAEPSERLAGERDERAARLLEVAAASGRGMEDTHDDAQ